MKDIPKEGKGGWSGLVTDINIALTLPCDSVDTKPVIYLELGDNSLIWATWACAAPKGMVFQQF